MKKLKKKHRQQNNFLNYVYHFYLQALLYYAQLLQLHVFFYLDINALQDNLEKWDFWQSMDQRW